RMYATWALLSTYCSLYVPFGVWLLRRLDRRTRLPVTVTLPVVWTALEYMRGSMGGGFPWYFLAHCQHDYLPVIQISDLAGAYGLTFLMAAVNGWLFELLWTYRCFRRLSTPADDWAPRRPALRTQTCTVLLLLAATLGYGYFRLGQETSSVGPVVSLIQGNLDQRIRNAAATPEGALTVGRTMARHYAELCDLAAQQRPDLIVWPETSWPGGWYESPAGQPDADSLDLAAYAGQHWRTNVLLGVNTTVTD